MLRIEGEAMSINSKRFMTDTSGELLRYFPSHFPLQSFQRSPKESHQKSLDTILSISGKEVAGYRKKLLSLHATAYVTVELNGDHLSIVTLH